MEATSQKEESKKEVKQEKGFKKLTPYVDVSLGGYQDAFDFVFDNDDVQNIAITGDYGIGKSSLIRSYEKRNKNKKFLYISLIHIESNTSKVSNNIQPVNPEHITPHEKNETLKDETLQGGNIAVTDSNDNNSISDSVLEKKLINQLIQSVPHNKIPYTSFTVKRNKSRVGYFVWSILTVLFIAASLFTINYEKNLIIIKKWLTSAQNPYIKSLLKLFTSIRWEWGILFYIAFFLLIILYRFFIFISYRNGLSKDITFNINNVKVGIKNDKKESYFDDHLDDILYMFENLDVDAVVFEDIERFHNYRIFEQLREINDLVNKRISNKSDRKKNNCIKNRINTISQNRLFAPHKPVRFFYLVHENTFPEDSMVKFFDFIIPVIPALHSKDSINMLQSWFEDYHIDNELLKKTSIHIYDYSKLKKFYNEFLIMKTCLPTTQQESNELLSVIIYKNLMPQDFSLFLKGDGILYDIMNKDEWINKHVNETFKNDKEGKKKEYENKTIKQLIGHGVIPRETIESIKEPGSNTKERELIIYLIDNGFLTTNIFRYLSQYNNDSSVYES